MLNDWEVAARLTLAINQKGMDAVSYDTQTPSNILLDMCGMTREFNLRVLDYLKVKRVYLELEPFAEAVEWHSAPGSSRAHKFAVGRYGEKKSKCGTVTRKEYMLTLAPTLKRCSICEKLIKTTKGNQE